jgi:hypothetical protein
MALVVSGRTLRGRGSDHRYSATVIQVDYFEAGCSSQEAGFFFYRIFLDERPYQTEE